MYNTHIIIGLGYGDEAKGATVDLLTRYATRPIVVRYNGGCQAGHNVVTPEGLHHTFQQFGAGSMVPYARTYLSRFMLVEPVQALRELDTLNEITHSVHSRTYIDKGAQVITPMHRTLNRLRERHRVLHQRESRHGSTGQGIGEAVRDLLTGADVLRVGDLLSWETTLRKLTETRDRLYPETRELAFSHPGLTSFLREFNDIFRFGSRLETYRLMCQTYVKYMNIVDQEWLANQDADLIFEGAQGVMLDEKHPVNFPHVTWSNTTSRNAETILSEIDWQGRVTKLGLIRSYATRHGHGPFPAENDAPAALRAIPEPHNDTGSWQGEWRVGPLNTADLAHSIAYTGGIDGLVVSHLDYWPIWQPESYVDQLADDLEVPLMLTSSGPTWRDRRFASAYELRPVPEDVEVLR